MNFRLNLDQLWFRLPGGRFNGHKPWRRQVVASLGTGRSTNRISHQEKTTTTRIDSESTNTCFCFTDIWQSRFSKSGLQKRENFSRYLNAITGDFVFHICNIKQEARIGCWTTCRPNSSWRHSVNRDHFLVTSPRPLIVSLLIDFVDAVMFRHRPHSIPLPCLHFRHGSIVV